MSDKKLSDYVLIKKHSYVAFNKPAGMPSQSDQSQDTSIHQLAEIYSKQKLHLLNRLDRPASGVVLFSKKDKFTDYYQKQAKQGLVQKKYLAICKKGDIPQEGTLENYLFHNKKLRKAHVVNSEKDGKLCTLKYKVVKALDRYLILEIDLVSGRFHQIRAQLAHIGCPIKGDVKYGDRRSNKDRSIYLHAFQYAFKDPVTKKEVIINCPPNPEDSLWKMID
jgi:23S rRNA pseudouridine1911/1915/1917 synthase